MKKWILFIAAMFATLLTRAQQDPLYAQYYNNPLLINPAFAGSQERLFAGIGYREQWAGMEGAPITYHFNAHLSLKNNKIGVGAIVVNDQLGDFRNGSYALAGAYRLAVTEHSTLSFGMQAGFNRYSSINSGVSIRNPDPLFSGYSETNFTIGAGLLWQSDSWQIGLSVPRLLDDVVNAGGQSIEIHRKHLYVSVAKLIFINERLSLRPSTLVRSVSGAPVSLDVNANLIIDRKYGIGVLFRNLSSPGLNALFTWQNYRIGYTYEPPLLVGSPAFTSHEITFAISLSMFTYHQLSPSLF